MKCQYHPNNDAIGVCVICGRAICGEDMNLVDGRYICNPCIRERKRPLMRRKSPFLALLLNGFPGLGYIYLGLWRRALFVFLTFAVLVTLGDAGANVGIFIAATVLFALIDGFHQGRIVNANFYETPIEKSVTSRSTLYAGIAFIVVGAILLINQFVPIDFSFLTRWWPILLVGVGLYLIVSTRRSLRNGEEETMDDLIHQEPIEEER